MTAPRTLKYRLALLVGAAALSAALVIGPGGDSPAQADRPDGLERYVGVYDVAGTTVQVTRSADGLSARPRGEKSYRLYPASQTSFFTKDADAYVDFTLDASGRVTGAVLHQDGHDAAAVKQLDDVRVSPDVLARYAGTYEIAGTTATVEPSGQGLIARIPGQGSYRLYPESTTSFFARTVDAQVAFTLDSSGAVTGGVLRQDGEDIKGKKVR